MTAPLIIMYASDTTCHDVLMIPIYGPRSDGRRNVSSRGNHADTYSGTARQYPKEHVMTMIFDQLPAKGAHASRIMNTTLTMFEKYIVFFIPNLSVICAPGMSISMYATPENAVVIIENMSLSPSIVVNTMTMALSVIMTSGIPPKHVERIEAIRPFLLSASVIRSAEHWGLGGLLFMQKMYAFDMI